MSQPLESRVIEYRDFEIIDDSTTYSITSGFSYNNCIDLTVSETLPLDTSLILNNLRVRFQYGAKPYARQGTGVIGVNGLLLQQSYTYRKVLSYIDSNNSHQRVYILGEGSLGGSEGTHKMTYFNEKADTGENEEHYGNAEYLYVVRSSYPANNVTVMEWDISNIPSDLVLTSAILKMTLNWKTAAVDFDVSVHEMLSSFVVGAAEDPATAGQSTHKWAAQPTLWDGGTDDIEAGGGVDWVVTPTATFSCLSADVNNEAQYNIDLKTLLAAKLVAGSSVLRIYMQPLTVGTNWTLKLHGQASLTEASRPELKIIGVFASEPSQITLYGGNSVGVGL